MLAADNYAGHFLSQNCTATMITVVRRSQTVKLYKKARFVHYST